MPVFKGIYIVLPLGIECVNNSLVKVKWGKQKFEGVEVDTDELPEVFKMQLFSLTGTHIPSCTHVAPPGLIACCSFEGVSPERQKVMIGGMTLSDTEWGKAKAKIKDVSSVCCRSNFGVL